MAHSVYFVEKYVGGKCRGDSNGGGGDGGGRGGGGLSGKGGGNKHKTS